LAILITPEQKLLNMPDSLPTATAWTQQHYFFLPLPLPLVAEPLVAEPFVATLLALLGVALAGEALAFTVSSCLFCASR
jgi:hypothetical protein